MSSLMLEIANRTQNIVFTSDKVFGILGDLSPVGVVELGIFSQSVSEGPQLGQVPERFSEKEMETAKGQFKFDWTLMMCTAPKD